MDEVEVQVVQPQVGQGLPACSLHVLVVTVPQLAHDEDFLARAHAGVEGAFQAFKQIRSILIKVVLLPNENCRVKTFQRSITLLVFDENDSDLSQVVDRFCIKQFHFDTVAVE